ncbi:chromosomal replication initiator DnaA [Pseudooceanicola sp. 216_PA32_1]|uniref:Chromosomal replication initiator DnaA n=1 Tax=Pseudooceanicola pacificus TaxID=2676438 RepID=A0A844WCE8_9RHOB|nr:DnaA/Hda family protein [Pseudooceanicola pacificus]MWB77862.1 chromosomal replication initiator DnaA [Pseudooceanicola pacificus]
MARQLSFDLPVRKALEREDFFVAPANALALAMIDAWPGWPGSKLLLIGPPASGKTHLAHVWAERAGARVIAASALRHEDIPALVTAPVAVEDVPDIGGDAAAEQALFHLHNLVLAEGHSLLMTADRPPARWPLTLPDLLSRAAGAQAATLEPPDDALLVAVLAKLFADRQIVPGPDVIPYLVRRIDRSFASARAAVDALDAQSLAEGRAVTRPLAARVLDSLEP